MGKARRLDERPLDASSMQQSHLWSPHRLRRLPQTRLDYQQCMSDPTTPCSHHPLRITRRDQVPTKSSERRQAPDRDLDGRLPAALRAAMEGLPSPDGSHGERLTSNAGGNEYKRKSERGIHKEYTMIIRTKECV
jgi:hypothetical protein